MTTWILGDPHPAVLRRIEGRAYGSQEETQRAVVPRLPTLDDPLADLWTPEQAPPSVGARPIGRTVPLDCGDDLPDPESDDLD